MQYNDNETGMFAMAGSIVSLVFGLVVPIAILGARYAIRRQRQAVLQKLSATLLKSSGQDASSIMSFEFALQKYDMADSEPKRKMLAETFFYGCTAAIFVAISSAGLGLLLSEATPGNGGTFRILLVGIQPLPIVTERMLEYELRTVSVLAFSFLGAYVWSIQYLIRRISSFDLTPMSFLRVTSQIILACGTAVVLRHILPETSEWAGRSILLVAFLIGFFPNAGLDYIIQKIPQLRIKRLDPDVPNAFRAMPVEIVDGIDTQVSFRLAEREVLDIENLATENPILLCTETPYSLLQAIDWIAQAQLILEVGPKCFRELRGLGVRTIVALEAITNDAELEKAILRILYDSEPDRPGKVAARLAAMKASLHVARLYQIYDLVRHAIGSSDPAPAHETAEPATAHVTRVKVAGAAGSPMSVVGAPS